MNKYVGWQQIYMNYYVHIIEIFTRNLCLDNRIPDKRGTDNRESTVLFPFFCYHRPGKGSR